jgi:hypothetical protein
MGFERAGIRVTSHTSASNPEHKTCNSSLFALAPRRARRPHGQSQMTLYVILYAI